VEAQITVTKALLELPIRVAVQVAHLIVHLVVQAVQELLFCATPAQFNISLVAQ
jgi:hypothetical protein